MMHKLANISFLKSDPYACLLHASWSWKKLFWTHFFALLLIASWILPPTSILWDWLDESTFRLLNGSIATSSSWKHFWALASMKKNDLFEAFIMGIITMSFAFRHGKEKIPYRIALLVCWFLYAYLSLSLAKHLIGHEFNFRRNSPSLVLQPVVSLSQLFPEFHVRDSSHLSFPSDHCMVLWLWVGFMWHYSDKRYKIPALFVSLLFASPRLVGGAHWLTDEFVGSLAVALISFSWLVYTPLHSFISRLMTPFIRFLLPWPLRPIPINSHQNKDL